MQAEKARRSLREFVRQAWHVVEPGTVFRAGWHIDAICDHLEAQTRGQIRKLLINVPPRTSKSTIVSVMWPAWEWIQRPELRYLTCSYALSLAIEHAVSMRRIVESEWYRQRWGHSFTLSSDQSAKLKFDNSVRGYRITTAVDAGGTGRGGDRIIVDDPHDAKTVESDAHRKAVIEWWRATMSARGNDPKTVTRTIVMQRVHQEDLSGYVLKEEGGYEHLCLPMKFEPDRRCRTSIGFTDPRAAEGELLQPDRFGEPEVKELEKSLGSYSSAGQLQQRPAPAEGAIFKRHWFKRYRVRPRVLQLVFQSWDCAFKDAKDSSMVVGEVWGVVGADLYLLHQLRAKMSFVATCAAIEAMRVRFPETASILVEDKANGPAIIDALRRKVPGLLAVEPRGSKEARAHAASPTVEAGNVWIPENGQSTWEGPKEDGEPVEAYLDELCTFPAARYDDQMDATTQAILNRGRGGAFVPKHSGDVPRTGLRGVQT